ncbi:MULTISPECIES: hypothetical protein [unclassified Xanthobacter]|uniref:hypothetical protein n=1 Tax=unclassified Xanthobacter TaxID=2623496 RepID=UPI001F18A91C|nr:MULTISPECIES: hypothetical protein [unclassified Xanthobacter]
MNIHGTINMGDVNITFTDEGLAIDGAMPNTIRSGLAIGSAIVTQVLIDCGASEHAFGTAFLNAFGDYAVQAANQAEEQAVAQALDAIKEMLAEAIFEQEEFDLFDPKHSGE